MRMNLGRRAERDRYNALSCPNFMHLCCRDVHRLPRFVDRLVDVNIETGLLYITFKMTQAPDSLL